ncbi:hypothetical protein IBE48_01595 [Francisella philomiragia]|uniref:NurA domain-containing protein n=1 Tax=Francisella philomiragia TaxID=28110 RepID=A0AAW3DBP2_9GAMM|nr:hypothetical protein [Francisella philomiragia]KFJ42654.1 hypothetical protein DR78_754 [Francisella philomiragia]MBK2254633.1 hypothetical protein [Francisella philomiragia]MBK2273010.1 hypothetical protein [Francisella philomiragia]MBK2276851.1 hypothetical protein [Francisella philomiragia]MBK2280563.1 hypothetical protein [Francisella philomiragia]
MPYKSSGRLPGESASKLGHLAITKSQWVKSLLSDFDSVPENNLDTSGAMWEEFSEEMLPLKNVWATDGSFVSVKAGIKPQKELTFVKTALLKVDRNQLDKVDKEHPHPLILQDIMKDSAIFHATVFSLKNVRTTLGSNYDTIRNIIYDSMRFDQEGVFYETLKWIAYQKWDTKRRNSPAFKCPCCGEEVVQGFSFDEDEMICPIKECGGKLFLTDMIGFHLDMEEDSAPESVASSYMLIMEHLMLFTIIRLLWDHTDKKVLSNTLFIKDGSLALYSQYSKLVPPIRAFLQFAKEQGRDVHIIGQEKSGAFFEHLGSIAKYTKPYTNKEKLSYFTLSHDYVRKEVYRSPNLINPYGSRTNWGEKLYVKLDPVTYFVLSIPTGDYNPSKDFPTKEDLIGLDRILATLPSLISRKFEGALYPIELANGIASMSSYPSATILKKFAES